jgi:hypothetical protein
MDDPCYGVPIAKTEGSEIVMSTTTQQPSSTAGRALDAGDSLALDAGDSLALDAGDSLAVEARDSRAVETAARWRCCAWAS